VNHGSLFSGIGGFDLAAQWCGWNNIFQVEIDKFCQKVLEKNFPETNKYLDIKNFINEDAKKFKGHIDVISGGFPCQPFSVAGQRKGTEDDRFLWNEMFEAIQIIKPQWCVIENVSGLISIENGMVFDKVLSDLESEAYEVQPLIIPAISVNAPHRRDRIWIVANYHEFRGGGIQRQEQILSNFNRNTKSKFRKKNSQSKITGSDFNNEDTPDITSAGFKRENRGEQNHCFDPGHFGKQWHKVATELCRVDNGLSKRFHKDRNNRLKALGNAIVPQVAYNIFKAISNIK